MSNEDNSPTENINLGRRVGSRYFSLCAGGNRDALMRMHGELNMPGSVLKKLLNNPLDETPDIDRWLWESPKEYCKSYYYPITDISEFLNINAELVKTMGRYRNEVSLTVVLCWKFIDNNVHGFYLPPDLIKKLSEAGLGFEIDIASFE